MCVVRGPIRRLASLDAPPKDPTPRRATSLTQELNLNAALVKFVCTTDFSRFDLDVFQLATQHPRPLSLVAEASLLSMNVLDSLPLRAAKVHRFLALLDGAYVSSNPYHNAMFVPFESWFSPFVLIKHAVCVALVPDMLPALLGICSTSCASAKQRDSYGRLRCLRASWRPQDMT